MVVGAAAVVGAAVDGAGAVGFGGAVLVGGGGVGGVVAAAVEPAPRMPAVNPVTNINETVGFMGRRAYPWSVRI